MLREAQVETRRALKQMAFLEAFRMFKARKARKVAAERAAAGLPVEDSRPAQVDEEDEEATVDKELGVKRDGCRQPYCFAYILKKRELAELSK